MKTQIRLFVLTKGLFLLTNFVLCKEVRNLPRGEQVVDQDQELFISDLGVAHQERRWKILQAGLLVEVAHVCL